MSVARFHINRVGATLRIQIEEPLTGTTFSFDNAAAGQAEWAATLLLDRLRTGFFDRIREIRREAYEAGWKDAKARDGKRSWFSDCVNNKLAGGPP